MFGRTLRRKKLFDFNKVKVIGVTQYKEFGYGF